MKSDSTPTPAKELVIELPKQTLSITRTPLYISLWADECCLEKIPTQALDAVLKKYTLYCCNSTLEHTDLFYAILRNGLSFHVTLSDTRHMSMRACLVERMTPENWNSCMDVFQLLQTQSRFPAKLEYTNERELFCWAEFDLTESDHPDALCAFHALSFMEFLNMYYDFSALPSDIARQLV